MTNRSRHILRAVLLVILLLAISLVARGLYSFRDRTGGYTLDLTIISAKAQQSPQPLRVGFSRLKINPDLSDTNRPIWIAGFGQQRAATGIHDDLWAIGCVIDDGVTRIGIVALDAIGF